MSKRAARNRLPLRRVPLSITLLAARYRLLSALLTPVLFVFRQINTRQEHIEEELIKRDWPLVIDLPEWRWKARGDR